MVFGAGTAQAPVEDNSSIEIDRTVFSALSFRLRLSSEVG